MDLGQRDVVDYRRKGRRNMASGSGGLHPVVVYQNLVKSAWREAGQIQTGYFTILLKQFRYRGSTGVVIFGRSILI